MACENLQITVESNKVYCILDSNERILLDDKNYLKNIYRTVTRRKDILLDKLISMKAQPVDAYFGRKRGEPVDRY